MGRKETKKPALTIALILLFINVLLISTFNVRRAKAAAAKVYIKADGSIFPSSAPLQRNGSIYTLTGDIETEFDGIWIEKNNIILDGAEHTVFCNTTMLYCNGVYLSEAKNITIKNIKIVGFSGGLYIYNSFLIQILQSSITGNSDAGISVFSSTSCTIKNNTIANNWNGIYFVGSSNNISENTIKANNYRGITLFNSLYNNIVGNNITENDGGIILYYSKYNCILGNIVTHNFSGIGLLGSSYNCVIGNVITENYGNAVLLYNYALKNKICGNHIKNNDCGICSDRSSENILYHNSFENNAQQVDSVYSVNIWDNGYPEGGNFWSTYMGTDLNNDGIGDTPYIIDSENTDRYPLMEKREATVYVYPSVNTMQQGKTFNVDIYASLLNNLWTWQIGFQWDKNILEFMSYTWGEFQTFAGATKISELTVNSSAGKTSIPALQSALKGNLAPVSTLNMKLLSITFKAVGTGTCQLKLIDSCLKGQNENELTVYQRWSDVNGDGLVDDNDITLISNCWREGRYNQTLDLNNDNIIDITDISIVTSDFGKNNTDPQWHVTNTIYDISLAVVNAQIEVQPSEACISVPYHEQIKGYYCGPAALEMVFDFYGPDIPQIEIADVARTSGGGTYTVDMVRAAHFSNLSTSLGKESPLSFTGYTARKFGYIAFECGGMTIDDLKALILAGYPIIVLTTWHFRVVVGYDSKNIIFQDSLYGSMYKMEYSVFDTDWDYSGHWGLFVCPLKVEVSNPKSVVPGEIFNVTATMTYSWMPPFPREQYPLSAVNASITLPDGLVLVEGETRKKAINIWNMIGGESTQTSWTVQALSLGGYAISVEFEGLVSGFVPPIPGYNFEYFYNDRVGGLGQNIIEVSTTIDDSPPTTIDDYDGLWHNQNFKINLTANDAVGIVMETYYRINNGPVKTLSVDGQPYIITQSANNTLEYWSIDWARNEELPHKWLQGIKLDKTSPIIATPSRFPSGHVEPNQEVKVTVNVRDTVSGVKNVELLYLVTGSTWKKRVMNYNAFTGSYEATIPAQPEGARVMFGIITYDNAENSAVNDNSGKYYVYEVHTFSASITPASALIQVGSNLTFTSKVSGMPPYHNQWYLNGVPIQGANSDKWVFKPTNEGVYHVYLEVTDYWGDTMQSNIAYVKVLATPVGGYSFSVSNTSMVSSVAYLAILMISTLSLVAIKHGVNKKKG